MAREPVYLNIYSKWMNDYLWKLGMGAYHSGIEVYGTEYCYGGHSREGTGIYEIQPKCEEELGNNYKFKKSIRIDCTDFTRADVINIVNQMGEEYQGCNYHLLTKNCNHFTDALAKILCGKEIPSWVNRLAYVSSYIPFLEKAVPRAYITPGTPPGYDDEPNFDLGSGVGSSVYNLEGGSGSMSARSCPEGALAEAVRPPADGSTLPSSPRQLFNSVMGFLTSRR